jgi:hypothetical protein
MLKANGLKIEEDANLGKITENEVAKIISTADL